MKTIVERAPVKVNGNTGLAGCEIPRRNNVEKNIIIDEDTAAETLERQTCAGGWVLCHFKR